MVRAFTALCLSAMFYCPLYGQAVPPLTSTVNGVIWQETKPADGTRTGSEKKVAGILVKLLDAVTQEVVATTLSNENGEFSLKANAGTYVVEYVYPGDGYAATTQRVGTDNSINSAADDSNLSGEFTISDNENVSDFGLGLVAQQNTLTFCTQKESVVTEWTQTLMLPKSSISVVPLNVKLFAAESVYHPMIGIENTGTANDYSITTSGKITMTMPISPATLTMNSDVSIDGQLGDYDGVEDYSGISGTTFYNRSSFSSTYPARNTSSATVIANNFVGSSVETFSIPTKAQSTVSFTGAGNLKTAVQTFVSAGACVVYTYPEGALPVKLASFTAKNEGSVVNVDWSTVEESASERFEVQRSNDGKNWAVIGSVKAQGTSSVLTNYKFADIAPMNGQNLYRLRMIDVDGTFALSRIAQVSFDGSVAKAYPNPASTVLNVRNLPQSGVSTIRIYNLVGQLVKEVQNKETVDVSRLASGTYLVNTLYTNGASQQASVMIAH
jgi:hypothetical protein